MSQSRKHSLMESLLNTASAFVISWLTMWFIVPLIWPIDTGAERSFWITVMYTVMSIIRNYFWRRYFNSIGAQGNARTE